MTEINEQLIVKERKIVKELTDRIKLTELKDFILIKTRE